MFKHVIHSGTGEVSIDLATRVAGTSMVAFIKGHGGTKDKEGR
jgi:hypothetical protein